MSQFQYGIQEQKIFLGYGLGTATNAARIVSIQPSTISYQLLFLVLDKSFTN
ncbi:MAG: hypothetical protein F6K17_17545 [Okeania sp. SIO3C4]|nr:hypothetical protein [Okeania sp. SIO3B3]NER04285.1 hypothetical protein [Okeania sp. SIO3C4]